MLKRVIISFISILLTYVGAQSQRLDITTTVKMEYSSSIVKIMLYDPAFEQAFKLGKGSGVLSTGSGAMVHESGVIFTNRHIIEKAVKGYIIADVYYNEAKTRTKPKQFLTYEKGMEDDEKFKKVHYVGHPLIFVQVFSAEKIGYELYIAEVISYSSTYDGGAIIKIVKDIKGNKIEAPKFKSVMIGNSNNLEVRDDLIIAGYSDPVKKHITSSIQTPIAISSGDLTSMNYNYQKNFHYYNASGIINNGKNGGPVFDINNKLVGIVVIPPGSDKTYIAGVNTLDYLARVNDDISSVLTSNGLSSPKKIGNLAFDEGKRWELPKAGKFVGNRAIAENFKQVVGQLKNVDSNQPISNGIVGLFEYNVKTRKMTPKALGRTDANGNFKMKPAVPFKEYYLLVKADGFKPIRTKKAITSHEFELSIGLEKIR